LSRIVVPRTRESANPSPEHGDPRSTIIDHDRGGEPPPAAAPADWPAFERGGGWAETQDYLHLITQMLGKLRLALAPPLPEWSHASLSLTPRGLTTRTLPSGHGSVEAMVDLVESVIRVASSDGRTRTIRLVPARPIADVWSDLGGALGDLGIEADLWDKPQERTDATPFSEDHRERQLDQTLARSWFDLLTELDGVFDEWRSPFFGRSRVGFWWGGFDLTVEVFNGRHAVPRAGVNYIMRHDLDAEVLSLGFWPGSQKQEARFFGYLYPEPIDCPRYPMDVASASWAATMGEWVLPYRTVREAEDRRAIVRRFMDTVLRAASDLAGWDLDSLTYVTPPRGRPKHRGDAPPS
jgi:hypothetical protein